MTTVTLSEDEIRNCCIECGSCCRCLTLQDKTDLSNVFGRVIVTDDCPYSTNHGCSIYNDRPEICRKWICGIKDALLKRMNVSR